MSGIGGIVHFDGAPPEAKLLEDLADSMAFRAPDGSRVEIAGRAGLVHAAMKVEGDPPLGEQPLTLDGTRWITAHARLYGRMALVQQLSAHGSPSTVLDPDAILILRAFGVWGPECLEHLNGDFTFVIWDSAGETLFGACDHFGRRPLFYSANEALLVFSNTLSSLIALPGIGDELNDEFIGDFLLFDFSLSPEATAYRGVYRVPPAHYLLARPGQAPRVQRYWSLPEEPDLESKRTEVLERFSDLLAQAVSDRLPDGPVTHWLSGGLDASSVAAIAVELRGSGQENQLRSLTLGSNALMPDTEPELAALIAGRLGLAHTFQDIDPDLPYEGFDDLPSFVAEPLNTPYWKRYQKALREAVRHSRVVMGGEGGDELLSPEFTLELIGRIPLRYILADFLRYLAVYRRRPALGIRRALRRRGGRPSPHSPYYDLPSWLAPDFVNELGLADRAHESWLQLDRPTKHPVRPAGSQRLARATMILRDQSDPGCTGCPLELREPMLDVRVVEFMFSVPALYWCTKKALLRESMRGRLPDETLKRSKTPVLGDLMWEHIKRHGRRWEASFSPAPQLERYVDLTALRAAWDELGRAERPPADQFKALVPVSLNYWLWSVNKNSRCVSI